MSHPPPDPQRPLSLSQPAEVTTITEGAAASRRRTRKTLAKLLVAARAVADAEPARIESTVRQLGESRAYLAPVAWAAGAIVLLIRGVKLLFLNWRLTLVELVPAVWVWVVFWDLRQHALRAEAFRQLTVGGMLLLVLLCVAVSIASFWCNTVFAFAISDPPPPRIAPAAGRAKPYLGRIVRAGIVLGVLLALGAVVIPRIDSAWLSLIAIGGLGAIMLITFVAVPARILGVKKRKLPPTQAIGKWTVGGALSAVAMTPGFILDRLGLIMLGLPYLRVPGLVLLSIGSALYAAAMSSVKAVKLSMVFHAPEGGRRTATVPRRLAPQEGDRMDAGFDGGGRSDGIISDDAAGR